MSFHDGLAVGAAGDDEGGELRPGEGAGEAAAQPGGEREAFDGVGGFAGEPGERFLGGVEGVGDGTPGEAEFAVLGDDLAAARAGGDGDAAGCLVHGVFRLCRNGWAEHPSAGVPVFRPKESEHRNT